ncbi:MAG TPA: LacI family transcriptional regulator [Clostridiales bacterium]|nr:LacI family transcriptional regulator [Clostridiales bacterium]
MWDVAKQTGLSIATVSKYINGIRVKESNAARIQQAIDELGYRVNMIARGLKTNRSMTVGVLIPSLVNLFSTSIVSAIERVLQENGYSTFICDYNSDPEMEENRFRFLMDKSVDGIIIMPTSIPETSLDRAVQSGIPLVSIDRPLEGTDTVLVDNFLASYEATQHLIQAGHRRIGIITGPGTIYTARERYRGYMQAMKDSGIDPDPACIRQGDYELPGGHALTREILDHTEPPTALFVTNYEMTLGAVIALNEMNVSIPRDLSFIGFDNLEMAQIIKPRLTIVMQPVALIGKTAADLLLRRLSGDMQDFPVLHRLKTELIPGDSVIQPK